MDGGGIYWPILTLDNFSTCPQSPIGGFLSTACIVLSLSLTVKLMIKQRCSNASYTIFRIASSSMILELPSKLFEHSYSSAFSPLLSAESHFLKAF